MLWNKIASHDSITSLQLLLHYYTITITATTLFINRVRDSVNDKLCEKYNACISECLMTHGNIPRASWNPFTEMFWKHCGGDFCKGKHLWYLSVYHLPVPSFLLLQKVGNNVNSNVCLANVQDWAPNSQPVWNMYSKQVQRWPQRAIVTRHERGCWKWGAFHVT